MNNTPPKQYFPLYVKFFSIYRAPRVLCHVFESEEASFIAQSIGQAFQVAYVEFLRANGIDDPSYLREIDYQVGELLSHNFSKTHRTEGEHCNTSFMMTCVLFFIFS